VSRDASAPDAASSAAALDALLDPAQPLVLFAWLTNRRQPWLGPYADGAARWDDVQRVQMGYTNLWLVRRVGVWVGDWSWDDESVARQGNPELVAFERAGSPNTWRGSRFEDPVTTLVDGRDPTEPLALCLLERDLTWH
jgi:hypothetical protein